MSPIEHRIGAAEIEDFAARVLAAVGLPVDDAAVVADAIVRADMAGVPSHGVSRLPQYVQALRRGEVKAGALPTTLSERGGVALIDGDNGMGHLVMARAVDTAMRLARAHGVAWVGVRRSNHAGAGGVYVDALAREGFVAVYAAVSGVNCMAPEGGGDAVLGTNPLAVGIPAEGPDPMVLDFATSATSLGKVRAYAAADRAMPEGWMVRTDDGAPLHDARAADQGLLLPMAGHKGSGLAIAIGLLAGALNGSAFASALPTLLSGSGFGVDTGQLLIVLDVAHLRPRDAVEQCVQDGLDAVANSRSIDPAQPVRWPGQMRGQRSRAARRNGLRLTSLLRDELERLALSCAMAPLSFETTAR